MSSGKRISICLSAASLIVFLCTAYAQTGISPAPAERFIIKTSHAPMNPSAELLPIVLKRRCGYIDRTGKIVAKPEFDRCSDFYEGLAVVNFGARQFVINKNGHVAFEPQLQLLDYFFSNGLIRVCQRVGHACHPFGYLDRRGKVAIKPQFEIANSFSEGRAAVLIDGKWGYIDTTGKLVIPAKLLQPSNFSDGLARIYVVERGVRWVFINRAGEVVLDGPFGLPGTFLNGFAPVKRNHGWSVMDKTGKIAFEPQRDAEYQVSERAVVSDGLIRVTSGTGFRTKWGFVDISGKIVIAPQFEQAHDFSDGLAAVQLSFNGKWGYIDRTGAVVIKPQFDIPHRFIGGIARVENGRYVSRRFIKVGMPQRADQVIDPLEWDGEMGYIDRNGRYIWTPTK